ncbi:hypothetical protein ACM46_16010 [Chryseobacterium angstadtii]|uniref:Uncharacterized protein n=1 Tax=Chryseobacterium angstadtii TaxID=558151 RepID=A0A0J7KWN9_9FLAO|nr:hypothetical protein [Chryseobacterium angstadtii]KMQ61515.1 hypothetical protein ACM46_16010 [Chryseobacterium angstadtii]
MNYRYFTEENGRFHLKNNIPAAMIRFIGCLIIAAALYFIIPPEKKIGVWGAVLFVFFALVNLLKTTKKLVIDPKTKTIIHKNNILNSEAEYRFDEFEQFYVLVAKYLFITMDSTAFFIFNKGGKEKRVPIIVGLFGSKKVQNAINEVSDIMNLDGK